MFHYRTTNKLNTHMKNLKKKKKKKKKNYFVNPLQETNIYFFCLMNWVDFITVVCVLSVHLSELVVSQGAACRHVILNLFFVIQFTNHDVGGAFLAPG